MEKDEAPFPSGQRGRGWVSAVVSLNKAEPRSLPSPRLSWKETTQTGWWYQPLEVLLVTVLVVPGGTQVSVGLTMDKTVALGILLLDRPPAACQSWEI